MEVSVDWGLTVIAAPILCFICISYFSRRGHNEEGGSRKQLESASSPCSREEVQKTSTEGVTRVVLVNQRTAFDEAVAKLEKEKLLALLADPDEDGRFRILQIATRTEAYIFDMTALKQRRINLRKLNVVLNKVYKIGFDFRMDQLILEEFIGLDFDISTITDLYRIFGAHRSNPQFFPKSVGGCSLSALCESLLDETLYKTYKGPLGSNRFSCSGVRSDGPRAHHLILCHDQLIKRGVPDARGPMISLKGIRSC